MIRAIILDFDGVILESVDVKTDAFRNLFSVSPESVDAIVSFHQQNGGMSRFDKFDFIYKNILKEPLSLQQMEELSARFSTLVFEKILSAPFVPGAYEFIKKFHSSIPLYIVSATPEDELARIASQRGLTPYFRRIYGSPTKKRDCIQDIITHSGIPCSDIVFVGDAMNDLNAARDSGIRFIGRILPNSPDYFTGSPGVEFTIKTLHDLAKYIENKRDHYHPDILPNID